MIYIATSAMDCDEEYIEESAITFGEWFKEHQKAPSPIYGHQSTTDHATTVDNSNIVGREGQHLARMIKESIFIRITISTLNRNIGKCNLP